MDGSVGSLHCRYIFTGPPGVAGDLADCLDRVAHERLPESLMADLEHSLGRDPTVYVLRSVRAELLLRTKVSVADSDLAEQWGKCLSRAVTRTISHNRNDSTNLAQFASEADYVAHFLADLIKGTAWDQWFYRAFFHLRKVPRAVAMRSVLLEKSDQVPAILKHLYARGVLEDLFSALAPVDLRVLWEQSVETANHSGPEALRPLFCLTLDLVRDLRIESDELPAVDSLIRSYIARYPPQVDWRDAAGLAEVIRNIVAHLIKTGAVRRPLIDSGESFLPRITQGLASFGWLDRDWLERALIDLLFGPEDESTPVEIFPSRESRDSGPKDAGAHFLAGSSSEQMLADAGVLSEDQIGLPLPRVGGFRTPRQEQLLGDLLDAFQAGRPRLNQDRFDTSENALRLYACLVNRHPQWMNDPLAATTIRTLVAAADFFRECRGNSTSTPEKEESTPPAVSSKEAFFRRALGEDGLDLVRTLAGKDIQVPKAKNVMDTACAGIFLFVRAFLDLGLPGLTERARYPATELSLPFSAVMLALGLCFAGNSAIQNGRVDAGLSLLAGLDTPPELETLRDVWRATVPEDHERFHALFLQALVSRRVAGGPVMHLCKVPVGDAKSALVASDELMRSGVMCRLITQNMDPGEVVTGWVEHWQGAVGESPRAIVVDQCLAVDLGSRVVGIDVMAASEQGLVDSANESAATHREIREGLVGALAALCHGLLKNPEAELALALAAIAALRTWARWLRQFAGSSVPFLLDNFIRRRGIVYSAGETLVVEMEPRPLDIVLEMAGYTAELEHVPWLRSRRVRLQTRGL